MRALRGREAAGVRSGGGWSAEAGLEGSDEAAGE